MPEINLFEQSLRDISALLNNQKIDYMVIGGLANAKWGNPRATLDIDYLEPRISELASLLENPGIKEKWDKMKKETPA